MLSDISRVIQLIHAFRSIWFRHLDVSHQDKYNSGTTYARIIKRNVQPV